MDPKISNHHSETEKKTKQSGGFNWQRYKSDRRELHEKLVREQEQSTPKIETNPQK